MIKTHDFTDPVNICLFCYKYPVYAIGKHKTEDLRILHLHDIVAWSLIAGRDALMFEETTDGTLLDPNHKYICFLYEDGSESTFRESHCVFTVDYPVGYADHETDWIQGDNTMSELILKPSSADLAIRQLIQKYHVYGAEVVINALVRATKDEPYLDEKALVKLFEYAYNRERRTD